MLINEIIKYIKICINEIKYIKFVSHWVLVLIIYCTLLVIFFMFQSNMIRFVLIVLLYIFSIIIFKIKYIIGIISFLIAIGCTATEHILIKYSKFSWFYIKPDLFTIPLWLIPVWGLAIILSIETSKILETIF